MTSPVMASVVKIEPSVRVQELDGILKMKEFLGVSLISVRKSKKCGQREWKCPMVLWIMSLIFPLLCAKLGPDWHTVPSSSSSHGCHTSCLRSISALRGASSASHSKSDSPTCYQNYLTLAVIHWSGIDPLAKNFLKKTCKCTTSCAAHFFKI